MFFLAAAVWVVVLTLVFGCWQRRTLQRLWREPMLIHPVVIIESDDWGPGPAADAEVLLRLIDILVRHRDQRGRCAVMTLGMMLAVPDTARMRTASRREYYRASISEPRFGAILAAIRRGVDAGAFGLQLHGMEHYWPEAVLTVAHRDEGVRAWLVQEGIPRTECLPSPLQSRWVDASMLPSRELPDGEIAIATAREADEFSRVFGMRPVVVVPPTFVWGEAAEIGWAKAGVRVVVTPGARYHGRDHEGKLIAVPGELRNGEIALGGMIYVVRDDYFEPALGHGPDRALAAIEAKTRAGRPALLETHRFNFTGPRAQADDALRKVDALLGSAAKRFPDVRFISTIELATAMVDSDPDLIECRAIPRFMVWLARLAQIPRMNKLAWITGAIAPAWLCYGAAALVARAIAPQAAMPTSLPK